MTLVADDAVDAISNVDGRRFEIGQAAEVRHPTTGSSLDWLTEFVEAPPYAFHVQVCDLC